MPNVQEVYEPNVFEEEKGIPKWEKVVEDEQESLIKKQTWDLIALPLGKKPIFYKSVYKVKYKEDGTLDKYKAWLVKEGRNQ
jgi:hypothetical protein